MQLAKQLQWVEPLELAAQVKDEHWVLLYSSVRSSYSGRYSYLACGLAERLTGDDWQSANTHLSADQNRFENAWFGYLGYGLKNALEKLTADTPSWLALPELCLMRFDYIYQFDHEQQILTLHTASLYDPPLRQSQSLTATVPEITDIRSNLSREEYLAAVTQIVQSTHKGDLYQANLTRKFIGKFATTPHALSLFARLCEVSPAPYSAYMRLGDTHLLSSSPELFLRISESGHVATRPIKGTAPRSAEPAQDEASRLALIHSEKDRAENLMITDLMRNDLSRSCKQVNTDALFEVTTHATIHHMSSTVSAQKRADTSTLDVVERCFPPGSMTGAPKIRAMELCSQLERDARGVYSGALGWFGGDGSAELSVVIRTLLLKGDQFEFQVGGGIVADSKPELELAETMHKARGILAALGIGPERLP